MVLSFAEKAIILNKKIDFPKFPKIKYKNVQYSNLVHAYMYKPNFRLLISFF